MTPEQRERVARAEAKLKGWELVEIVTSSSGQVWIKHSPVYTDGAVSHTTSPALDPTTAGGARDWRQLLASKFHVELTSWGDGKGWTCDLYAIPDHPDISKRAEDETAATCAAVIAYAERGEK